MTAAPERLAEVYDRCAPGFGSGLGYFETFGARLVELAAPAEGDRVLDVAAGRGACLFPAAERVGPTGFVQGVDLSAAMTAHLAADIAERGVANAAAARMDAQAPTVPEAAYDVVLCAFALFLMPDPRRAAAGFRRALRPGGRCAVSVPAAPAVPDDAPGLAGLYHSYARVAGLGPRDRPAFGMDLQGLLRDAGLTGVAGATRTARFVFPGIDAWWDWTWTIGTRALYERLTARRLRRMRADVHTLLEPALTRDGLPMTARCHFATAVKPPQG